MKNEIEDNIWESVLKVAVEEYTLGEIKDYISDDEINRLLLPKNYKIKMDKFITRYRLKKNSKSILIKSKKIASVVLIIMGITFAYLLQFENVRAACKNVIINVYEKFIRFDFISSNDNVNNRILHLEFLPDSYQLKESNNDKKRIYLRYENIEGKIIELTCYFQNRAYQLDNEKHSVTNIKIRNYSGKFFEANDGISNNYLIWYTDEGSFMLSACLEQHQMIKIAENIK